jgi:hypothetical protein
MACDSLVFFLTFFITSFRAYTLTYSTSLKRFLIYTPSLQTIINFFTFHIHLKLQPKNSCLYFTFLSYHLFTFEQPIPYFISNCFDDGAESLVSVFWTLSIVIVFSFKTTTFQGSTDRG